MLVPHNIMNQIAAASKAIGNDKKCIEKNMNIEKDEKNHSTIVDIKHSEADALKSLKDEMIHKLKLENERYENTYTSCCLRSDKRALEFFLKSFVIFSVLAFAMLMSLFTEDVSERNAFINIVILILGTFLPSPKIKEDKKK